MKHLITLVVATILILIGLNIEETKLMWIGFSLIIGTLIPFIYESIQNRKRIKLALHCKYLALKKQNIRFSMSYLYRIKIEDKYLLVKNSNFGHFQLVGGKYKRLKESQSFLKSEFKAMDDLKLPNKGLMKDDFAIFIPASKAINFLDWFNKKKDREISHWREFYEELIKTKILSQTNFPYVNYNYVGTVTTPIKRTSGWDCFEILQYDILDLIPTKEQEIELITLLENQDSSEYKWADDELIKNLGHDNHQKKKLYQIGEHTKWALNMKWSKE
ncbi:MAG: hypothetical protein N4A35_16990 [Flavobacteriales bacterium]|jgi:hypothetical protein|nr:hypothetical protein [Flavobacteriales bacterium]